MRLVREKPNQQPEQAVRQYLTFMIGGEQYALSLLQIKEIVEYDIVTEMRDMPEWLRGVVKLRGDVVPVLDLAVKLRLAPSVAGKQTCIVVSQIQDCVVPLRSLAETALEMSAG